MYNYNQYPSPYNSFTSPYGNVYNQTYNSTQKQEIAKVNGENGAKAYNLAPNSSVLLLDETQPIIYLKTTDSGGYPTITPYSINPFKPEQPIDMKSLEKRIAKLEEVLNNEQSDTKSIKPNKSKSTTNTNVQDD